MIVDGQLKWPEIYYYGDYRKAAKDATWINGKKVVVWCFSAREFTEESTSGWVVVPVTKK